MINITFYSYKSKWPHAGAGKEYNFNIMKYSDEFTKAMDFLAKDPKTIFLGQAVEYPGTAMTNTLKNFQKTSCLKFQLLRKCNWE